MTAPERILSCIQPTGETHLGNYFGAIANWVRLQQAHTCIYGVVDLHAMTMPYDPATLRANSQRMALDLLACGVDTDRCTLFLQSLVPEHLELCWILACVGSYGDLTRMTQFKDKADQVESGDTRGTFVSAGLFLYPLLQAADILVYRAARVPVGKDQQQHLELTREVARRFNERFGALFPEPQPLLTETPQIASLADPTKKMSKSLGPQHYVGVFEDEASIRAKIKAAVTDTGGTPGAVSPGVDNLLRVLAASGAAEVAGELRAQAEVGKLKYVVLKEQATTALLAHLAPLRQRRQELSKDLDLAWQRMCAGSQRARELARETLGAARQRVGLPPQ